MDRGNIDDATPSLSVHATPSLSVHMGQGAADEPERCLEHHGEHRVEDGGREVLYRADQLQPGVVDQHVRARGGEFGGVQVHEVEYVRLDTAVEALGLLGQRLQADGIPVDGSHLGAGGREPQRAGAADAAGCTGDEGGTATEVEQGATGVERAWGAVMSRP
ncbi:hypothetical protein GCM10027073_46180 [Streptomyces chlorus]